jgi:hypothetical protein
MKSTAEFFKLGATVSAASRVTALKLGSQLPQRGHDHENRWVGEPSLPRRISWMMMGV